MSLKVHIVCDMREDEDHPKWYMEKSPFYYTYEEDGIEYIRSQKCCPGCFPIFQLNQLAHMEYGGCLFYQEE